MNFKLFLSVIVMLFSSAVTTLAIEMKVGETKTLDAGYIANLQYAQWTVSRPDCVEFITPPSNYSTSVTVKAIKAFTGSPCTVQCTYRYLELDPVTGKYIYSRSGYKSWSIFVSDNNSGGDNSGGNTGGGNTGTAYITLNTSYVSCRLYNWSDDIEIYSFTDFNMTWTIDDPEIATIKPKRYIGNTSTISAVSVYGKKAGTTTIRVRGSDGSMATCTVTIQPLSVGDTFASTYGYANNELTYYFEVMSIDDKTCSFTGLKEIFPEDAYLFDNVLGYELIELKEFSFRNLHTLKSIYIPMSIQKMGSNAFKGCESLTKVVISDIASWCCIDFFNEKSNPLYNASHLYLDDSEITELVIPNTVTEVCKLAFINCTNLSSIEIPNSIKKIGNNVFQNCIGLKEIYSLCVDPPSIYKNTFDEETYKTAILRVPSQGKKAYTSHQFWGKFKNIVSDIVEPEDIALSTESIELKVGEKYKIETTILPEEADDNTVVWSSDNSSIATVDESGNITALSVGTTIITATCGNISASCNVTVVPTPVESINISPNLTNLKVGESIILIPTILPDNATNRSILWSSSDESIAIVDDEGKVTALKVGETDIVASTIDGSGISAICRVIVNPVLVEAIALSPENWIGEEGKTFKIEAVILPHNATDQSIIWSSSDNSIAMVNDKGTVSVLKDGNCVITAIAADGSGVSADCIIIGLAGIDCNFKDINGSWDVYDINGLLIKKSCSKEYMRELTSGIYIIRQGTKSVKILIR